MRFKVPERESRSLSSSTLEGAERRSKRRDLEVNKRRGVEERNEMDELKPSGTGQEGGGEGAKSRGGDEGEGELDSSHL